MHTMDKAIRLTQRFLRDWRIWAAAFAVMLGLGFYFGWSAARGESTPSAQQPPQPQSRRAEETPTLWTCAMHPQIKLPKPGLCPICNMELIPLETRKEQVGSLRELTVSEDAK